MAILLQGIGEVGGWCRYAHGQSLFYYYDEFIDNLPKDIANIVIVEDK